MIKHPPKPVACNLLNAALVKSITSLLAATLICLAAGTSSLRAQTAAPDKIGPIQEEIRELQRDLIDLQKTVMQSGVGPALADDLKDLKGRISAVEKQAGSGAGKDLSALEDKVKDLEKEIAKLSASGGSPQAPAPAETAQAPAPPSSIDFSIPINIMWVLITGYIVMFMQAGFALVETGFTRAKNAGHTMSMNFMVYALGMFGYWLTGFAIQFGGTGAETSVSAVATLGAEVPKVLNKEFGFFLGDKFFGIMGGNGFFLNGDAWNSGIFTLFLFQMVFMDTTATVPTGAMAERWKFVSFVLYGIAVGAIIYPFYGNWVWGGGWLAALGKNFGLGHGHVDFAGSSVVHMQGGILALVGAWMLGPRHGKYNKDGSSNPIPGHNVPMAMLGTFILAFGWFGFNPGSTLAGMDGQIGIIATNTMMAGTTGAIMGMLVTWFRTGKPDMSFMCNGLLAGLVAITAPCAFVESWAACLIGAIAGILVVYAAIFVEETLKIDDPVGAVAVHGFNGLWGVFSLGIFANGKYGAGFNGVDGGVAGLLYGDGSQLVAQCVGILTCIVFVGAWGFIVFKGISIMTSGMRTKLEDEIEGLDIPEMGAEAYPIDTNPTPR
jgi:Amt family ammonium transporter